MRGRHIIDSLGAIFQVLCSDNCPSIELKNKDKLLELRRELDGCAKLVLFNEYFFGRYHTEECITFLYTLCTFVKQCSSTVFYVNDTCYFNKKLDNFVKQMFISKINSYFTSFIHPTSDEDGYTENLSYSVYNGLPLTYYYKASFYNEFPNTVFGYVYGCGYDLPVPRDFSELTDGGKLVDLQKTLLENVGTEICFDLACKVRRMNNWSNDGGKSQIGLLLLQSSTIDPIGKMLCVQDSKNINNLPVTSIGRDIYILQADASDNPPAGSHLFKIDSTGGPMLYEPYATIDCSSGCPGLKITIYKVD